MNYEIKLAKDGSLEIPKQILTAVNLSPGDSLLLTADADGNVVVEPQKRSGLNRRQIRERELRDWIFSDGEEA